MSLSVYKCKALKEVLSQEGEGFYWVRMGDKWERCMFYSYLKDETLTVFLCRSFNNRVVYKASDDFVKIPTADDIYSVISEKIESLRDEYNIHIRFCISGRDDEVVITVYDLDNVVTEITGSSFIEALADFALWLNSYEEGLEK